MRLPPPPPPPSPLSLYAPLPGPKRMVATHGGLCLAYLCASDLCWDHIQITAGIQQIWHMWRMQVVLINLRLQLGQYIQPRDGRPLEAYKLHHMGSGTWRLQVLSPTRQINSLGDAYADMGLCIT
jgi:hypothetical protein